MAVHKNFDHGAYDGAQKHGVLVPENHAKAPGRAFGSVKKSGYSCYSAVKRDGSNPRRYRGTFRRSWEY